MIDYIHLQMDYLLSKITVTIIFLLLTVIILSSVYNAQILEGYGYIDGFRNEYGYDFLNETFIIIEFILVFLSVYIGMILAGKTNQSLMMYTVHSKRTKTYHISSRVLTGIIVIGLLVLFVSMTLLFITYILTPYQLVFNIFMKLIFMLLLQLIQYFMLTLILMAFINHFLIGLLPLLVFWLIEIISYDLPENTRKIIDLLIININGYNYPKINLVIYLIIFQFLSISYIIVMKKKDC